jgi:intracellular sulfur oxidation DsrE/DsrF family protein
MNTKRMHSRQTIIKTLAIAAAIAGMAFIINPSNATRQTDRPAGMLISPETSAEIWLNSLKGKNVPVVYDMHEQKDFWAGIWSNIYLATNSDVKNVGVAIVMRHGGFPFALNDAMFEKYKLGEFFNIIDKNTGKPSIRNMYYEPAGKDYPLPGLDGIKGLQKKGVAICVCNMALKVYSGFIAKNLGLPEEEVYNDFVKNILPGIQLVPSGVWALGRLQQAPLNYAYINAG